MLQRYGFFLRNQIKKPRFFIANPYRVTLVTGDSGDAGDAEPECLYYTKWPICEQIAAEMRKYQVFNISLLFVF